MPPGEWREFSVNARAPQDAGTYTQYWQLSDGAGHTFGSSLSISIDVIAPTRTPQPTNTAQPTPTATTVPPPTIASISPNSAKVGETVGVTITGSGFVSGAGVTFEGGQGTVPQVTSANVTNATTIQLTVNVTADATPGSWTLRVTNPNSLTSALNGAFTVNP